MSHEPTADPTKDDGVVELTKSHSAVNVAGDAAPARRESRLRRMSSTVAEGSSSADKGVEVEKRPSVLQRLKVAPIDAIPTGRLAYDEGELPPRSPTSDMRRASGLVRRKVSATVVHEAAAAQNAAPGENWHKMATEALVTHLQTNLTTGLTSAEAQHRISVYGLNKISEVERESLILKFFKNCVFGFSGFLLCTCALAFIIFAIELEQQNFFDVQTLALAVSLPVVVLITAVFVTFQEGQADSLMDQLMQMSAEASYVMRDGAMVKIPSEQLVPGDVVKVGVGEKVPADLRIVESHELKVNNAPLTGENIDVKLGTDPRAEVLFEAKNVARSGCSFTAGSGVGIVYATGDNTFLGKIARATTEAETPDTTLRREVRRIIFVLSVVSLCLSVFILGLSFGKKNPWSTAIVYVIGVIIANVPEGLMPQITLALSLTAKRMLRRGVLVSNLEIIETLGAVTVICSDKTGTITCNRMTVSHLYFDGTMHGTEWTPGGHKDLPLVDPASPGFRRIRQVATLNTDAVFMTFEPNVLVRQSRGDASEVALIKFFEPYGSVADARAAFPRIGGVPFNSSNKYMISVNEGDEVGGASHCVLIKGAAERVLPRCTAVHTRDGGLQPLDSTQRQALDDVVLELAKKGERVLAFASMPYHAPPGAELTDEDGEPMFPTNGFGFVGFISLVDPPRSSVLPALELCHSAGIQVYMVTGDHPATAVAICQSLGYSLPPCEVLKRSADQDPENTFCVVHGINDIPKFTEADWDFVFACKQAVFARTMPEQKQAIVHHLHKLGAIVAMTGDGVNDAAALKVAHVGIAMGSGSAVAREASQVVLLEDDFGAIVEGVREGRLIFDNLKKCIAYVLTHLVPEIIPFLVTIIGGLPLGMQTLVILFIDLGAEMAPGVCLAYEECEDNIMLNPPRTPEEHLVGLKMMLTTYVLVGLTETFECFWAFLWVFYAKGFALNQLWNRATDWGSDVADLDAAALQAYTDMCQANSKYHLPCADQASFQAYRADVLSSAQAVYFLHLVWCQFFNLCARRTQVNSGVTLSRWLSNPSLIGAQLLTFGFAFFVVYCPGVSTIVQFDPPVEARFLFTGVWIMPVLLLLEETKKFLIRRKLPEQGWLYRVFVF